MSEFLLTDRVAIVTGGGKGIGSAIARAFAAAGAAVAVVSRTRSDVEATTEEIRQRGGRALACPADVTDLGQLPGVVERTVREFGGLDTLVNCAGGGHDWRPFLDTRVEQIEGAFHFTVSSVFELTRLAVPHMLERSGASVINIGSQTVGKAMRGHLAYETAKAALTQMTKSMAADLGPRIRVNIIHPGTTETETLKEIFANMPEDVRRGILQHSRLRRNGTPQEVANAALYLASPAAAYVTGIELPVSGGPVDELSMMFPDL